MKPRLALIAIWFLCALAVAIGLLTIGVLQLKPKALDVSAWSSAVWADYYARKALVTASSVEVLDFGSHGPMPHSVPELRAELGM